MPIRVSPKNDPVYERPTPAICLLADALGISHDEAWRGLHALASNGYVVAPRLPTNAMLDAYLSAYGTPCSTPRSAIIGIGKARVRWAAMADRGTQMALSWRRVPSQECDESSVTSFPPCEEYDVTQSDAARDAIAMEARRAETPQSGSVHDSAGPQDIAQPPSGESSQ